MEILRLNCKQKDLKPSIEFQEKAQLVVGESLQEHLSPSLLCWFSCFLVLCFDSFNLILFVGCIFR